MADDSIHGSVNEKSEALIAKPFQAIRLILRMERGGKNRRQNKNLLLERFYPRLKAKILAVKICTGSPF